MRWPFVLLVGVLAGLAVQATSVEPVVISGTVQFANRPVEQVQVLVFSAQADVPLTTRSDVDGRFEVVVHDADDTYVVRAEHPRYAPVEVSIAPSQAADIRLDRGAQVTGRVVDADKAAPIRHAQITLIPRQNTVSAAHRKQIRIGTQADEDGAFRFDHVTAESFTVVARAPGLAAPPVEGSLSDEPLLVYMEPGFAATGVVTGPDGPVEGAEVSIRNFRALREYERSRHADLEATTDAEGHFTIAGIPESNRGEFTLWVDHDELAGVHVPMAASRHTEIFLHAPVELMGRLMWDEASPIEGRVTVRYSSGQRQYQETLELDDGRFHFAKAPPGQGKLRLTHSEIRPYETQVALSAERPTDLGEIVADTSGTVQGRVVDAQGDPIADVRIAPINPEKGTKTDGSGHFRLSGFDTESVQLFAMKKGYARKGVTAAVDGDPVTIRMPAVVKVRGTVLSGDPPRPLGAFSLVTMNPEEIASGAAAFDKRQGKPRPFSNGTYELELAPGRHLMAFSADSHVTEYRDIEIEPGEDYVVDDVLLVDGGVVRGRVLDQAGQGIAKVRVSVKSQEVFGLLDPQKIETTPDGRFELQGLALGPSTITFRKTQQFAPKTVELTLEAGQSIDDLKIVMGPGGTVEGFVRDDRGRPLADASVRISRQSGQYTRTDDRGFYSLPFTATGKQHVLVSAGTLSQSQQVDVEDGQSHVVNFPVPGAIRVEGLVTIDDRPVSAELVWTQDMLGRGDMQKASSDADGNYSISLSSAGTYTVIALESSEAGDARLDAELAKMQTMTVEIPDSTSVIQNLEFAVTELRGRVLDAESGEPLKNAVVLALRPGEYLDMTEPAAFFSSFRPSDENGEFEFSGLADGEYQLNVSARGYRAEVVPGVRAGRSGTVDVHMYAQETEVELFIRGDGQPVNARVIPLGDAFGIQDVRQTGPSARVTQLPDGQHELGILAPGWAPKIVTVDAIAGEPTRYDVDLVRGEPMTVEVHDNGGAVAGAIVQLSGNSDGFAVLLTIASMTGGGSVLTDESGRISFPNLAPGKYELEVRRGESRERKTVTVRSEPLTVEVDLD